MANNASQAFLQATFRLEVNFACIVFRTSLFLTAFLLCLPPLPHLNAEAAPLPQQSELPSQVPLNQTHWLEMQRQIQSIIPKITAATVQLATRDSIGMGVIVNEKGLIWTAAHVFSKPGEKIQVRLHDGALVEGKTLGQATATDAGLVQLLGKGPWPFLEIRPPHEKIELGEWCLTVGHPSTIEQDKKPLFRFGRVLKIAPNTIQTDCLIMAGDSGGALVDLQGRILGINSRIAQGTSQNYHVRASSFRRDETKLAEGEVITRWDEGEGGWAGLLTQTSSKGLVVSSLPEHSPSAKAGVEKGDVIVSLNRVPITSQGQFSDEIKSRPPGEVIFLGVRRGERTMTIEITLGKKEK